MTITDQHWSPINTLAVQRITSLDVSPDGRRLAFTVIRAVMTPEKDGYLAQVYLAESEGKLPRQLTTGETSSFSPQWSPNGWSIAFLSRNNIWLMSLPLGNTCQVTDIPTGVSSFKWSPDGSMIAFTIADDPESAAENDAPRIAGQGLKKQRLHLISLAELSHGPVSGRPLTGAEMHVGAPEVPEAYNWSPDGNAIVFAHCPSPQPNDWPGTRLALLNLADGSIQPLGGQETTAFDPHFSPGHPVFPRG